VKRIIPFIWGLLFFTASYSQQQTPIFDFCKDSITLRDLIVNAKENKNFSIYAHKDIPLTVLIPCPFDSTDFFALLSKTLSRYNLFLTNWHGNFLISEQPIAFTKLPEFTEQESLFTEYSSKEKVITDAEQRYLKGRGADIVETITVGSSSMYTGKGKVNVTGILRDQSSGETLIGATVFIEELKVGTATDLNGVFSINLEPGHYNARFDCIGQKSTRYQLNVLSSGDFTLSLERSVMQIDEVMVYGDKSLNVTTRDAGFERIPLTTLKELPMMLGERDVIKVSELLPGIVSIGEGVSGVNVRGGNYDQNGFFINKVPIYNTSHLFGFFPAFNPDVIKDFSIYKGHMPAEYGGRLSSVFNIVSKQGNRKRYNVRGGINPVTANFTLEGPIVKDEGSMLLSFRKTYSDWILKQISDPDIRNSSASFGDILLSANYEVDSKNQLGLFTYYSSDHFRLSDINQYTYSNFGNSLNWKHRLSHATRAEVSLITSRYSFNTVDNNIGPLAYTHDYSINQYEIQGIVNHLLNEKNRIEAGITTTFYNLNKGSVNPYGNASLRIPVELGTENGLEGAIFIADNYDPLPWLNVYLGLRYSAFAPLGERNSLVYQEGQARELKYVVDTLHYSRLQPIKWYHGPELRAALNFKTDKNGSVKVAFNQTRQNLFMLNNTITIAPNTQWQLASEHLNPLLGKQLSLGVFRNFFKSTVEFSLELFAKEVENISEFKDGANFIATPHIETMVLQGEQAAYGLEVMVRKPKGRLNGWVAYTYSRSIVEVDGKENWMKINDGIAYPSNYDVPHVINGVFNYRFNRRFNLSSTATYQTGRPITYPLAIYYSNNIPVVDYSARNEFRIPDYFRIDLSLAVEGNLKRNKLFHSSWVFGVYNLTGRKNPLSIYFKLDEGRIKGYKYSIIGTPIFTATWVFKLGNYATD
jgi:hypothetical protein